MIYLLSWNDFGTRSGVKHLPWKDEEEPLLFFEFSTEFPESWSLITLLSSFLMSGLVFFNRSTSLTAIFLPWTGILGRISWMLLIITLLSTSSWSLDLSWLFFTTIKDYVWKHISLKYYLPLRLEVNWRPVAFVPLTAATGEFSTSTTGFSLSTGVVGDLDIKPFRLRLSLCFKCSTFSGITLFLLISRSFW